MKGTKLFNRLMAYIPSTLSMRLIWLMVCLGLGVTLVQADGPNQIGLVVAYDNMVVTRCIQFEEDELSGYEVLERSGLDLKIDVNSGVGSAICRIDGQGCNYPAEDCFCECQGMTCIFWSYWHLQGGDWEFSTLGASNYEVNPGDVEGWVWGEGVVGSSGTEPPAVKFDDICVVPSTATPTPTATPLPTATPTATHTPPPTATPEPTDTPKPEPTPVIRSFSADRLSINAGESVTLRWDLSDAEAAYLRYDGSEIGVVAPGSQSVAPTKTTVYRLVAKNDGGEAVQEITITVNAAPPTTTPTSAPVQAQPVAQTVPTNTPVPAATPSPTAANQAEPAAAAITVPPPTTASTPLPPTSVPQETSPPPMATPTTTPEAIALAPTAVAVETLPPLNRRFTTEVETKQNLGSRLSALLLYGGMAGIILLFLIGPVVLLGVGWVAWWLRKER